MQSSRDLDRAEAQRGGHADGSGHHGRHVHHGADPAAMVLAEHRLQQITHQPAAVAVELEPGHRQAQQCIDGPGMQAPVEKGIAHGGARCGHALRRKVFRGLHIV